MCLLYLPCLGKIRPVGHHLLGEPHLRVRIALGSVERVAEHEGDLVRVQRAAPQRPRRVGSSLGEEVHVDVVTSLRVSGKMSVVIRYVST